MAKPVEAGDLANAFGPNGYRTYIVRSVDGGHATCVPFNGQGKAVRIPVAKLEILDMSKTTPAAPATASTPDGTVYDAETGEVVEDVEPAPAGPTTALVPMTEQTVSLGLIQASSARGLVAGAVEVATSLAEIVEKKRLYKNINSRKYVFVEAWTTLAAMMGCLPREVSNTAEPGSREDGRPTVYTAVVELVRITDGMVLTRASAECGGEAPWNKRDLYARRSMAATRATSKVCRLAFSWILVLAGFEATPAEEVPDEDGQSGDSSARNAGAKSPEVRGAAPAAKQSEQVAAPAAEVRKQQPAAAPPAADHGVEYSVEQDTAPTMGQLETLRGHCNRLNLNFYRQEGDVWITFPRRVFTEAWGYVKAPETRDQCVYVKAGGLPQITAKRLMEALSVLDRMTPEEVAKANDDVPF